MKYKKELEFTDPIGNHTLKFSVPPIASPNSNVFQYEAKIYTYNPETGQMDEFSGWEPTFTNGQDIDDIKSYYDDFFKQINQQNQNIMYGLE